MPRNTSATLGDHFDAFVSQRVSEGRFQSVSTAPAISEAVGFQSRRPHVHIDVNIAEWTDNHIIVCPLEQTQLRGVQRKGKHKRAWTSEGLDRPGTGDQRHPRKRALKFAFAPSMPSRSGASPIDWSKMAGQRAGNRTTQRARPFCLARVLTRVVRFSQSSS